MDHKALTQQETAMIDSRTAPYAALLLRVSLGILFLAHASLKFFVFTPAGTAKFFGSVGLPPALAYVVISAEVIGGIALILGLWSRIAAIALVPILLGAIFTVHGAAGFFFNNANGGWEYPAFWSVALLVQALLGDGIYALRLSRSDDFANTLSGVHSH
jgi:putative oxidoreductase